MLLSQANDLIVGVLTTLGYNTQAFVNLLLGTMAIESDLGAYEQQISGPANSIFMVEPATWTDIQSNFLSYHANLAGLVNSFTTDTPPVATSVIGNHQYACAIAACSFIRHHQPAVNTDATDSAALYIIYKQFFNGNGASTFAKWNAKCEQYGIFS